MIEHWLRWLAPVLVATAVACEDPTGTEDGDPLLLWKVPPQGVTTAPLILDDIVVFGTDDGSALALDRETGEFAWRQHVKATRVRGYELGFAGGVVVVPHYELWGLDAATGAIRWRYAGPGGAAGVFEPATSGDTVFTSSLDGWASSLDGATGEPYWAVDLGEATFPPSVSADLVIYGTRGYLGEGEREGPLGAGHVVALRRSDGSELWRHPLPDSAGYRGGAISGGVVWQDRVIVGTQTAWVVALSLEDGAVLWATPNGGSLSKAGYHLKPALVDGVVVLGRNDAGWEGWDAMTGERSWLWSHSQATVTPAVSAGDLVYTMAGSLTIGNAAGDILWRTGGLGLQGGRSYFLGKAGEDGTVYSLVLEHALEGGGTYIYAIRPPVTP